MLALYARFRGRAARRSALVARSAEALSGLAGVEQVRRSGVEDIRFTCSTPEGLCNLAMALLADGDWAVGIGVGSQAARLSALALGAHPRRGDIRVRMEPDRSGHAASDIEAAFRLVGHMLAKRSPAGREATALLRSGLSQVDAADRLGITKQAISQRLAAAGWSAEQAGWGLVVNLLSAASS